MSQQDNFFGGFVVGTLFGGLVGGLAGALVASKLAAQNQTDDELEASEGQRSLDLSNDKGIEAARRNLETKIAKLNEAIDDVQQQFEGVNGTISFDNGEQVASKDS